MRPKKCRLILLAKEHGSQLKKQEDYFKELFEVEEMLVVENEELARKTVRFGHDMVIVADDGCELWFPEHRLYKIFWENNGEEIAAILRGVRKWEKIPKRDTLPR